MIPTRSAPNLPGMLTKTIATATASALLAGGAVAYSDTGSTTSPAKTPHPPKTQGERHQARQVKVAQRQTALAKGLGITVDQLKAADGALLKRNLDVRVAKGTLTVAQRSAILACKAAPLTCDRTNLPVRAKKQGKKAAAKRKANASKRLDRRATRLADQLHLDRDKVLAALKETRKRG
jgi:hypothetical protein